MSLNWIHNLCRLLADIFVGQQSGGRTIGRHPDRGIAPQWSRAEVSPASRWLTPLTWLAIAVLFIGTLSPVATNAAVTGDTIVNSAWLTSNEVITPNESVTVTVVLRSPSTIELFNYFPLAISGSESIQVNTAGYSPSGSESGPFIPLPAPTPFGSTTPLDLSNPLMLNPTTIFHVGEPIFLRITDHDQNQDSTLAETIAVTIISPETGDHEALLITETGPDTGVFAGYLESNGDSAISDNGTLSLEEGSSLTANYEDKQDGSDVSTEAALVDPFGIVFDSTTGQPLNGVTVTLIDTTSGLPATVLGDDGVSSYPSTVITGAETTDSSGRIYTPLSGGFRFPLIAPGNYRLDIDPLPGYIAPSVVPTSSIQALPGAPFAIVSGSRGETFVINPGPAIHIDVPVDPVNTGLWVQKNANKNVAAIGDFIAYRIQVENFDPVGVVPSVEATDTLPLGFSYQKGSTRIDGVAAADPAISADGRTLTYSLGELLPQSGVEISYVTEIGADVKPGESRNTIYASGPGGLPSNTATALVTIREEFLRSRALLMGRVMTGGCEQPDTELKGLQNARIYLENGTVVITDEHGKYHFEGIEPGTHVVQLDLDSLAERYEAISCEENSQFAGRNFSQFVDIQGGTMWRADFHVKLKAKQRGAVDIELNGTLDDDIATFQIPIRISQIPLNNLRLKVQIPIGFEYIPGSSHLNGLAAKEPETLGQVLTYRLGDQPAGWNGIVTLQTKVINADLEELPTRAVLTFDSPDKKNQRTPFADNLIKAKEQPPRPAMNMKFDVRPHYPTMVATLSADDKFFFDQLAKELRIFEIGKLFAIGHTDNVRIAPENRIHFADNFALSGARARNVAEYLGAALNLSPEKIVSVGIADAAPVADNSTPEGRSLNRRVEIRIEGNKIDRKRILDLVKAHSGLQSVETVGLRPGETSAMDTTEEPGNPEKQHIPNEGILYPADGETLSNRIVSVRIELDANLKPRLTLDGKEIPENRIGFKMANEETGRTIYTYIGADMGDKGPHQLKLEGLGPFGNTRYQQEIEVVRTGEIADIRVLETDGNVADGVTPVTIRLQLLDSNGRVINGSTTLSVFEGTLTPQLNDLEYADPTRDDSHVLVDAQGYVHFQPIQSSGLYHTTLGYNNKTIRIESYVKPVMRDWIMVGFAEGTLGYNSLSGNQANLDAAGIENHSYKDGRVKFFAKGAIKGKWLLTMAYDSNKSNQDADSLHQIIDPDEYHPLYGDETQQNYEAASARKIYVKLERNQFYALFGDMQTDLTRTELSRYSRSMNGLKSELQTDNFEYKLFAAETRQGFIKDEIRGDGTSGRYYLSQPDMVINSEEITIEVRDRFQSEKIISSQRLQRHLDYDIDYSDGSLFFKRPIPSKDVSFNPTFIVARYETRAASRSELNYGGRAALKVLDQRIEIGASHIHEKSGVVEGDLFGVDATVKLNSNNSLNFEAASTDTTDAGLDQSGDAYIAELEHSSRQLNAKIYYREQDNEFGLGQQNGSESGTRKYGIEGTYRLSEQLSLSALTYHEDNLVTDAVREVAEAGANLNMDRYSLTAGVRNASDTLGDGTARQSQQLIAGGNWNTADRKLTLRATHEQSLGSQDENSDYPTLTLLGADYRINRHISIFAEQEFTWSNEKETEATRAGFKTTPWHGGDARTSVERQIDENDERIFALFGLGQTWQLDKNLSIDASLDRSYTLKDNSSYDFNTNVPDAHGSNEDFTAISLGNTYQQEKWSWTNRLEFRHTDNEDKFGLVSSLIGQVKQGISASVRVMGFITDGINGDKNAEEELTLGLAYRPVKSRWIFLDRLDARFAQDESSLHNDKSWRLVNNLHANFKVNRDWQIAPYYGLKYVRENFGGTHYDGFTDLVALESRYNLTKRWDIGLHGSMLHTWNSDQYDYSSGISTGYLFITNLWTSLGYNFEGFRDDDFSQGNYTAKGVYLKFRLKFDQNTLDEALTWLNGQ